MIDTALPLRAATTRSPTRTRANVIRAHPLVGRPGLPNVWLRRSRLLAQDNPPLGLHRLPPPARGHGGPADAPLPPLPRLTWAQALSLIVGSSKGISAVKLLEMASVFYETAWHLAHRARARVW